MAKRRPDSQLTQNNWDDELDKDEVGEFQKADVQEMKNRVIRVAKRRIRTDETDSNESGVKPVFSGFSLISDKSSNVGKDAGSAPKQLFSFGSGSTSQQPASSAPFTLSSNVGTFSAGTKSKTDGNKSSEFVTKLKELNGSVLSCIKGHIESGKPCILTPIFKDYEKYVKELEEKDDNLTAASPAKKNHENSVASTATAATFSFSFNAPKSTTDSKTMNTPPTSAVSVPGSSTQSNSLFSFGKSSTAFGAASTGFSFTSSVQASKPADNEKKLDADANKGGFSFSSAIQTPKPINDQNKPECSTNGNTDNAENKNDEPPKVEFKPVVEEESIYSKRCKVFVKDDGQYKDRGTGTLYLKNVKGDKVQLIVRADTNLGNILLNFLLSVDFPAERLKNNVVIVCIPTPESDQKPRSVLIRVKTEDDAKELFEEIKKYQK